MKAKYLFLLLLPAVGLLFVFSSSIWNSGCATTTPTPPREPDPVLIRWSEYLENSRDRDALIRTTLTLFESKGLSASQKVDIHDDPELLQILRNHPIPGPTAFIQNQDFRDFAQRFESPSEFREFLNGFENKLFQMKTRISDLRTEHLFPKFFEELKTKSIRQFSDNEEHHKIYTQNDLNRYDQLSWFAETFRSAAIDFDWDPYRNHFRDSRRGSTISILDHVRTMNNFREGLFNSAPETLLSEILIYIRDNFPAKSH